MHIYVTVLNTDIGFICHLRRAVYRSTGLHGPKEDDDDDDDDRRGGVTNIDGCGLSSVCRSRIVSKGSSDTT